jgi:photosystem I P700 chlorophyll a apoprotein A1
VFFRYVNPKVVVQPKAICSRVWSKAGDFNKALSKGPKTTTWIWNLHSDAHDFHIQQGSSSMNIARKIFSSNLAHLSLVFFWIAGMHFHGAYFSNYGAWLKDPKHCLPSAHNVWRLVGQDILNLGDSQGINITSGFFQLWRSEGIITQVHLKYASAASLIATIISLGGSYFHMHISSSTLSFYKKFRCLSCHHLSLLFGLGSMSWSGHQIHISLPLNRLLDSGVDPAVIPCPQDLLFRDPGFSITLAKGVSLLGSTGKLLNPSTSSVFLAQIAAHHFYLAIVFIISGIIALRLRPFGYKIANVANSWHAQLSVNLAVTASLSITFAHHIYAMPVYPYCASDYPTVLCLFCHHIWIAAFLIIGAGAHASIFMIADKQEYNSSLILQELFSLRHRDVILGHLIWVTIA